MKTKRFFANAASPAGRCQKAFYTKLFQLDGTLRSLFSPDLSAQREKLASMLAAAVGLLDDEPALMSAVGQLGARHAQYGIGPGDFDPVGAALIHALRHVLGGDFTAQVEAAWLRLYFILSRRMIQELPAWD
jgi:hemoglobin-like flavoprotein